MRLYFVKLVRIESEWRRVRIIVLKSVPLIIVDLWNFWYKFNFKVLDESDNICKLCHNDCVSSYCILPEDELSCLRCSSDEKYLKVLGSLEEGMCVESSECPLGKFEFC